jgi:hypothetical protein
MHSIFKIELIKMSLYEESFKATTLLTEQKVKI